MLRASELTPFAYPWRAYRLRPAFYPRAKGCAVAYFFLSSKALWTMNTYLALLAYHLAPPLVVFTP